MTQTPTPTDPKDRRQPEGRAVCGAKLKNGIGHCRRAPDTGRSRCHVHGGATPRGLSSPHFKHGRYSTALPERLAATYEAALHDPELLNLRDEISLVDVRTTEMLKAAENIPVDWNEIRASMEQRRRLCETEQKRMLAMRQLHTTEQVMLIVTTLISAVRVHVHDRETLGLISEDFAKTLDRPGLREGGITISDDCEIDG